MYKSTILIVALSLCILLATRIQAQSKVDSGVKKKAGAPTIAVTGLDVSKKTLKLSYEIRNESEQDVWVLVGFGKSGASAEVFIDKDDRTILIRRRFDVPFSGGGGIAFGRYVLMRTGETQTELVSLTIPVHPEYGFASRRQARGLEYETRLAIEIGYYTGDLPGMIRHVLEEIDKIGNKNLDDEQSELKYFFRGSLYFNVLSEVLKQRDEEVLLPYTYQWFKGEQVLRTTTDGLRIPYEEKEDRSHPYPPDLPTCTLVEIQCQPSTLEYFFPYTGQQSLLSSNEKQDLRTLKTIVVADPERIKALAHDLSLGAYTNGLVRERRTANAVCYRDDERLISFTIYNDSSIVTEGRYRFLYNDGFRSLRVLTPQIQPFEFRVQCAANLRNLWNRLRLYHRAEKAGLVEDPSSKSAIVYPAPTEWCDAMMWAYKSIIKSMIDTEDYYIMRMPDQSIGTVDYYIMRPYMCPSAGQGKCHYALNSSCKPNSPPDTVLLFETKAGWNQHGGPELFTFDNHDPKGGCVLLNDGTVKFIRTKEELQQLRWK